MEITNFIMEYLFCPLKKTHEKYKYIICSAIVVCFLTYSLLIITGVTCPDGLCEGLVYYSGANWASRNGRWAIRYLNMITGNVVIPVWTVYAYSICISFVILMLTDIFRIQRKISIILMTAAMIASPTMIAQFLYTYMALAYGVSCLLSTFFVWILYKKKGKRRFILAIGSLTISLGLYQSYIGFSMLLIVMLLLIELLECFPWTAWIKQIGEFVISGLGGHFIFTNYKSRFEDSWFITCWSYGKL